MRSIRYTAPLAASVLILFSGIQGLALAGPPESEVLASTGTAIDDTVITTKIKAAYIQDPVVGVLNIQVDTVRGVVQLSGFANSETEKERAATITRSIEGVVEVKNDIRVKPAR